MVLFHLFSLDQRSFSFSKKMFLSHLLPLCILTALPAVTVASPIMAAQPSSAVCVDASQNSEWGSPGDTTLGPYGCAYALLGFKLSLRKNITSTFDFYSKYEWSHITPQGAWGLPDGATSSIFSPVHNPAYKLAAIKIKTMILMRNPLTASETNRDRQLLRRHDPDGARLRPHGPTIPRRHIIFPHE